MWKLSSTASLYHRQTSSFRILNLTIRLPNILWSVKKFVTNLMCVLFISRKMLLCVLRSSHNCFVYYFYHSSDTHSIILFLVLLISSITVDIGGRIYISASSISDFAPLFVNLSAFSLLGTQQRLILGGSRREKSSLWLQNVTSCPLHYMVLSNSFFNHSFII